MGAADKKGRKKAKVEEPDSMEDELGEETQLKDAQAKAAALEAS